MRKWLLGILLFGVGCGGGGAEIVVRVPAQAAPLLLTAGVVGLQPAQDTGWAAGIDLARLGVAEVAVFYDLTTPAGAAFVFDCLSRAAANTGAIRVSVAHVLDGGAVPPGGVESLAEAGIAPSATGPVNRGLWFDAQGDGFVRLTLRGSIDVDQVLAIQSADGAGLATALVRIRIGAPSAINVEDQTAGDYPGITETTTLYSSDSWWFGLPVVAVSGGSRVSYDVYEGDRADPHLPTRYDMRLQFDRDTNKVTGGAQDEASPDSGHWRDHEMAALFNVLALVNCGGDRVRLNISFDRGATFGQTEFFGVGPAPLQSRLCTIAMAADYTMAVLFWCSTANGASELVLVEGRPSAFDATNSPTRFEFDAPRLLFLHPDDVIPVLMGATYSDEGHFAVGYGFTHIERRPDNTWTSTFQNRCAVRLFGGVFRDVLVDEDVLVGKDPSVSMVGTRIFYAYEGRTGVLLRVSDDGGQTFSAPEPIGDGSAHMPTVIARVQDGELRVDLLYLAQGAEGTELHLRHWDDYGVTPGEDFRLTRAVSTPSSTVPDGGPIPGVADGLFVGPPDVGMRITQIAWFGYDAVLDGDDIEVVYHEETFDAYYVFLGAPFAAALDEPFAAAGPVAEDQFVPADPPPFAAGLTGDVDEPKDSDRSQLKRQRLD